MDNTTSCETPRPTAKEALTELASALYDVAAMARSAQARLFNHERAESDDELCDVMRMLQQMEKEADRASGFYSENF